MAEHFLFTSLPDRGHMFPHLAVVEELISRGNRVTFVTSEGMTDLVTATGATLLPYRSRYENITDLSGTASDNNGSEMLSLGVEEAGEILRAVESALAHDRPDLVAYDFAVREAGRILDYKWGLPAVQLSPVFAQNEKFTFAESFADEDGEEGGDATSQSVEEWLAQPDLRGWLEKISELMAAHGVDVPFDEFMRPAWDFNVTYVLKEFQPAADTFDERFAFVGPCLGKQRFFGDWQPPASDLPVVLISLGSVHTESDDFFRTCVRAFRDLPVHVVMTLGKGGNPAELGPLPPNIEAHQWVSHTAVLKHARAFVTHGGMTSVGEALMMDCPMVVIPMTPLDKPTGKQVSTLGLGHSLPPTEVTVERLRQTVLDVIGDDTFRENTRKMRQHAHPDGGASRAADEIIAYLRRKR